MSTASSKSNDTDPIQPLAVSLADGARLLGMSEMTLSKAVQQGTIAATKITTGRSARWIIPMTEIHRVLGNAGIEAQIRRRAHAQAADATPLEPEGIPVVCNDEYGRPEPEGEEWWLEEGEDPSWMLWPEERAAREAKRKAEAAESMRQHAESGRKIADENLNRRIQENADRAASEAKLAYLRSHPELLDALRPTAAATNGVEDGE